MRSWRPHLICCLVILAQAGLWWLGHRSDRVLWQQAGSSDPRERIEALFLLLERGAFDPPPTEVPLARELLDSSDPLLAEFAHTAAVCKNGGPEAQYHDLKARIDAGDVDAHFWRSFVLLRRKVGVVVGSSSGRLGRQELEWWLEALAEHPLPADAVLRHIAANP